MLGDGCSGAGVRLRRSALALRAVGDEFPKLLPVAEELDAAATAIDQGLRTEGFARFDVLLQVPGPRGFKVPVPRRERARLKVLRGQTDLARNALGRVEGLSWLGSVGPDRARDVIAVASGDPQLAFDISTLAPRACPLRDAALAEAGLALVQIARQVELLSGLLAFLGICEDDCKVGKIQDCNATEVTFAPFGDKDTDSADFKEALLVLDLLGDLLPDKALSPGASDLIDEIVKQLASLKANRDKLTKNQVGYAVFVRLTYEECVEGLCGNYWKERTKVVEIAPPIGKKKHELGEGWKQSVIEDLGKNAQATAAQLREFRSLAERQCP